jgi:hypothetical protein
MNALRTIALRPSVRRMHVRIGDRRTHVDRMVRLHRTHMDRTERLPRAELRLRHDPRAVVESSITETDIGRLSSST